MDILLKAAIIGTAQYPGTLPQTGTEIDTLSASLPQDQRERTFLLTAGALAIYQQAGQTLDKRDYQHQPAEPETIAVCSKQIAQLLTLLLAKKDEMILQEAFSRLQDLELRIPYELLPQVLEYGAQQKSVRPALLAIIGMRGHWLSQYNARWEWANQRLADRHAEAETIWQEGILEQRVTVLANLREQNPTLARSWLEDVWPKEKAETRQALVQVLQTRLSSEDEPFLQQALNDRSISIRGIVAELLLQLPNTPQSTRLTAQADELLSYQPEVSTEPLKVHMPEKFSAEAQKEIDFARIGGQKIGSPELFNLAIQGTPPQHWEERFGVTPTELISAAANNPWEEALIENWTKAAIRNQATSWYKPLFRWHMQVLSKNSRAYKSTQQIEKIFTFLDSQEMQEELWQLVEANNPLWPLLITLQPGPWTTAFSLKFLELLRTNIANRIVPHDHYQWLQAITKATYLLSSESMEAAFEQWEYPEDQDYYARNRQTAIETLLTQLQLRQRTWKEITR